MCGSVLGSKNKYLRPKIENTKKQTSVKHVIFFLKNMFQVLHEPLKIGLGIKIGYQQPDLWSNFLLQLIGNPAVGCSQILASHLVDPSNPLSRCGQSAEHPSRKAITPSRNHLLLSSLVLFSFHRCLCPQKVLRPRHLGWQGNAWGWHIRRMQDGSRPILFCQCRTQRT